MNAYISHEKSEYITNAQWAPFLKSCPMISVLNNNTKPHTHTHTVLRTTRRLISYLRSLRLRIRRRGYLFRLRLVPVASVVHSFSGRLKHSKESISKLAKQIQ